MILNRQRRLLRQEVFGLAAVLLLVCGSGASGQISSDQRDALAAIARGQQISSWAPLTVAQVRALENRAESYLQNYEMYHQPFGLAANILFKERERQTVEKWEGIGDAATWTGHYLAALAACYAVTGDAQVLSRLSAVIDTLDRLARVTGKAGFIARFAAPAENKPYERYYRVYGAGADPARPGLGTWAFRGEGAFSDWVWLGYPSPDVYIGVNLGLSMAFRLAGDETVRKRISNLVTLILETLIADDWSIIDPAGRKSRSALELSAITAWLRTGATVAPEKYEESYQKRFREFASQPPPSLCKYCKYYPNNLEFAAHYVLATLETDAERETICRDKLRAMWRQCSDHLNGYFAALYISATGDQNNLAARATVQGSLADFPDPPRWDKFTDHSPRTDLTFTSHDGKNWSRDALPVRQRVVTDFLWQRSPCELKGGSDSPLQFPGIDFLLPYWIARASGSIR